MMVLGRLFSLVKTQKCAAGVPASTASGTGTKVGLRQHMPSFFDLIPGIETGRLAKSSRHVFSLRTMYFACVGELTI
jgi:hypothetical protein